MPLLRQGACGGTDCSATDDVTASLLQEITQILVASATSPSLVKKTLAGLLLRYSANRFLNPLSKAEFYRSISRASQPLGDLLPNALDVARRGAKSFADDVRMQFTSAHLEIEG